MPKAWLSNPSARPAEEIIGVLARWAQQGYGIALMRDQRDAVVDLLHQQYGNGRTIALVAVDGYPGYGAAVNALSKTIFAIDPDAEWICASGDDTLPDPTFKANELADQFTAHFNGTFGAVQPTGDRWGGGHIDRIAGSAFWGREWCRRAHQGAGPLCPLFKHMFVDEAAKYAAEKEGVYLMRPDLVHFHKHFKRTNLPGDLDCDHGAPPPPHLEWCNTSQHWVLSEALYKQFRDDYDQFWRPLPA